MLLPERISEISDWSAQFHENPDPYPPTGFCPFSQRLRLVFGGAQSNDDYAAMEAATESYLERRRPLRAVTLMQTYAELMFCVTKSFQARYGFNGPSFLNRQRDIFLHDLGTNRIPRLSQ
jgi:hypothetical protein